MKGRSFENMAKKKVIQVKDVLDLFDDHVKVCFMIYAYGIYYGSTFNDGMKTAGEVKEQINTNCKNALVTSIESSEDGYVVVSAELVY